MSSFDFSNYELDESDGVFTFKNENTTLGFVRFNDKGEVEYIFVNPIFRKKGIGRFGQTKSILSIGLGCEAKYAKDFVYTENINVSDKTTEIPIGVSCRTCDRLDCPQRAFPPLNKKFDVDLNSRGVSVYVSDNNS